MGGYYLRLNKNNRGYLISVGLLSHDEKKLEKLRRKPYAYRRLRAILQSALKFCIIGIEVKLDAKNL